jgi:ATP-binding cassette, subfamily B, multidrug efflux pump
MRNVFAILLPYRTTIIIALFFMLTELAVELWQPLLMSRIINQGIEQQNLSIVLQWGGLMVLLALVGFASGIINSFYAARVSQGFGFDVRKQLFQKIQTFSFTNLNQFSTATLITRVTSDVSVLQNAVFMGLRIMMRAPLMMLGGLILALMIDLKLALILAVVIPLLFLFLMWSMTKAFKLFTSVQKRLDRTNGVLRENLLGMKLIKAFVRSKHEIKRFTEANEQLMKRTVTALQLIEFTAPLLLLLMNLSVLVILWMGNVEVIGEGANVGEVVAVVNYAARITGAFSAISMIIMNLSRAKASLHRIEDVLTTEVDMTDSEQASANLQIIKGKIEFNDVHFGYENSSTDILKSISFIANAGETIAIMGATGAGKSSLFQLIPRLYDVNCGSIKIDDNDIRNMQMSTLREQIGYVPQEAMLFSGTVKDNILWGKDDASMEEVIEAARNAQIHDTIMKLPNQYDTIIGQKGVNLSGGQKQRLSIARALIRKPKILLLDDSTSALDLKTEARLLKALHKYPCTILIITQKVATALQADNIIILEDGQLLAQGSHELLYRTSDLYQQIVSSQFGKEGVPHA